MCDEERKNKDLIPLTEGFIKKGGLGQKPKVTRPAPPIAHRPTSNSNAIDKKKD